MSRPASIAPRIVVIGSIIVDRVVKVPSIVRPGETLSARSIEVHPGGKGANQATAAALAGASVAFVGRTGRDGAFVLDALAERGVDVSASRIDEGASGTAFVHVADRGENAIAIVPEANARFDGEDLDRAVRLVRPGDLVLLQNETAMLEETFEALRGSANMRWLNAAPAEPRVAPELLEQVDVLLVNETEAAAIAGSDDPHESLAVLGSRLPRTLVVATLGPRGAIARHGDRHWTQQPFQVEAVDTVGCGDAFIGAMAAAIARGADVATALREGGAAGALAATRPGAIPSLPTRGEIDRLLAGARR